MNSGSTFIELPEIFRPFPRQPVVGRQAPESRIRIATACRGALETKAESSEWPLAGLARVGRDQRLELFSARATRTSISGSTALS